MYKAKVTDPNCKYRDSIRKLNILIVDDDEDSRELLRNIIETRGHNVTTLDEGMKCVNRCSKNNFDIIFMDYHINDLDGELNGIDIAKLIKECFNLDTIIYAYTGDCSIKALSDFKNNKMKGAFIKPIEPTLIYDFFRIVENKLDNTVQLSRLARKKKKFFYFGKKNNASNIQNKPSA